MHFPSRMARFRWHRATRITAGLAAEWALLWALWLLCAGSAGSGELLVGAIAAAVGTLVSRLARATKLAAFRPHPIWMRGMVRLPLLVARDAVLLVVGLVHRATGRRSSGRLFELALDASGHDPSSASYRALVTTFTSLPPNTFVIDIDLARRAALVHRLVPTGVRPSLIAPGWRR